MRIDDTQDMILPYKGRTSRKRKVGRAQYKKNTFVQGKSKYPKKSSERNVNEKRFMRLENSHTL